MNQTGIIKKINGKKAVVEVRRPSSCGDNCGSCSAMCKVPLIEVKAEISNNAVDVIEGDNVELSSENISVLKYAFVLYGLPLVIMVGVIFLVSNLVEGETGQIFAALGGILSLILSFFILKKYDDVQSSKNEFNHIIIKKIQ